MTQTNGFDCRSLFPTHIPYASRPSVAFFFLPLSLALAVDLVSAMLYPPSLDMTTVVFFPLGSASSILSFSDFSVLQFCRGETKF